MHESRATICCKRKNQHKQLRGALMKKILILGAGVYQVPLIKKAKEMGLYTIVSSIKGEFPGFELADKVYYEDTTDIEAILKIAEKERIEGICTSGTDVAVKAVGYVCDKMGLPGISYKSACIATDKAAMKAAFRNYGVKTSDFYKVSTAEEALNAYKMLGPNVVMKITDKSGSRGIICVDKTCEVEGYFNKLICETQKDYLIVEQYVKGHEIGIDAMVQNGEIMFIAPHDKITYNYNGTGIPIGHILPFLCNSRLQNEIIEQTILAIKSLKLNNCAVNIDAFVCVDNSVSIIEIGGRSGATGIPELISMHYGIDFYKLMIENALGEKSNNSFIARNYCASRLIYSEESGILEKIILPDGVVEVSFDRKIGDKVEKFTNGTCRIGSIILNEKTEEDLLNKLKDIDEHMYICVRGK